MNVQEGYELFSNFAYDHQEVFAIVVGGTTMVAIAALIREQWKRSRNNFLQFLRGKTMTKKQRLIRNRSIQSDAISDALFRLVENGDQTIYDIQPTLRQLATFMFLTDLHVKKLQKVQLTEEEAELLQSIMRSKEQLLKLVSGRNTVPCPGGHPKDTLKVDKSYIPKNLNKAKALAKQGMSQASALEELEKSLYPETKKPFGGTLVKTTG